MNQKYERYFIGVNAYTSGNSHLLNQVLHSKSVTPEEKLLLLARKLFAQKKHAEALQHLDKKTPFTDSFLDAERCYLLSNCYSYISAWEKAVLYAEKAYISYRALDHQRGIFLSGYNLSAFFNRLGLHQISYKYLCEIESSALIDGQKALLARALACYYSAQNNYLKAGEQISITIEKLNTMNKLDQVTSLSVALDIFFRLKRIEKFESILKIIGRTKILRENLRLEFDRICFYEFQNKSTLGSFKPTKSILNSEEYLCKFKVLSFLRDGEVDKANEKWNQLCDLMPQRYSKGFKCVNQSDEHSLFMSLIAKLLTSPEKSPIDENSIDGKMKTLYEELSKPGAFKRRENLIEAIWKTKYDPSYDARFYKLIERFKKTTGISLVKKNRCYSLPAA